MCVCVYICIESYTATGLSYSDDKAAKILSDILGGREATEDDTFASADFFWCVFGYFCAYAR